MNPLRTILILATLLLAAPVFAGAAAADDPPSCQDPALYVSWCPYPYWGAYRVTPCSNWNGASFPCLY